MGWFDIFEVRGAIVDHLGWSGMVKCLWLLGDSLTSEGDRERPRGIYESLSVKRMN